MATSGLVVTSFQGVTVASFRNASILDMPVVQAIADELYALVDKQAQKKILLDFDAVRFLSSQMIGTLIALNKKSKDIGGRVILCGLKPEPMKVFKIMKLEKILEFAADEHAGFKMLEAK